MPSPTAKLFLVAAAYLCFTLSLCNALPLWLDEILQLIETRRASIPEMLLELRAAHPGSAPLGYLLQPTIFAAFGYSTLVARSSSALFGAGTLLIVGFLAMRFGVHRPWLAALLFGLFPISLRYATESRPYAQALFFATWSTHLHFRLMERPSFPRASAYCLALVLAAYTQPFALSVGLAHFLWTALQKQWRAASLSAGAFLAACAVFLPWYAWSKSGWTSAIGVMSDIRFSFTWRTPFMILRELIGAGYWGTGILILLCAIALRRRVEPRHPSSLLVLLTVLPVMAALSADAFFDYFIAARQFLWICPALAIMAALGIEAKGKWGRFGAVLLPPLAGLLLWYSGRYFTGRQENWEAAAAYLAQENASGACIKFIPEDHGRLYRFFQPKLAIGHCNSPRRILAISPYSGASLDAAGRSMHLHRPGPYLEIGKTRMILILTPP